jgi:MoaA/NifB/PqqE/SkfB family radical SAM enzyme
MRDMLLELELTGRCQLHCQHCYAGSGPTGAHGTMTTDQWRQVVNQAAEVGAGMVQLIGGEPTLHPDFAQLLAYAIDAGLKVEVFSNLVHVAPAWWALLEHPGVMLATSYYSDDPAEHDRITGRRGSHARTLANIAEAVRRQIPIRVGMVFVLDGQRVEQASRQLRAMGVRHVVADRLRRVGRGATGTMPGVAELCGWCGRGRAAVSPTGDVSPCVIARWLVAGNVRRQSLGEILDGPSWTACLAVIPARTQGGCPPHNGGDCDPACDPTARPRCAPEFEPEYA